jgi:hypothetical protein
MPAAAWLFNRRKHDGGGNKPCAVSILESRALRKSSDLHGLSVSRDCRFPSAGTTLRLLAPEPKTDVSGGAGIE